MSPKTSATILSVVATAVIVTIVTSLFWNSGSPPGSNGKPAYSAPGGGTVTIITISADALVPNATYTIAPFPASKSGETITVQDGGQNDSNPTAGVITVGGISSGNYTVTQTAVPPQFQLNKLSRLVTISGSQSLTVSFSNTQSQTQGNDQASSPAKSIVYTVKFECGTISGSEGPLRPGHYDTDISIFNKQDFPVKLFWSASLSKGALGNTILQTLQPHTASAVVCKDLTQLFSVGSSFAEGFISIEAPLDPQLLGELSDNGTSVVGQQSGQVDPLDVQVFYTANALDTLPHPVYADKIVFTILNDSSSKIPSSQLLKLLDVTVPSDVGQISDPEDKVKQSLAAKYGLSDSELDGLKIRIESVGVGVGTMIDDHAISLSHVPAQTKR